MVIIMGNYIIYYSVSHLDEHSGLELLIYSQYCYYLLSSKAILEGDVSHSVRRGLRINPVTSSEGWFKREIFNALA